VPSDAFAATASPTGSRVGRWQGAVSPCAPAWPWMAAAPMKAPESLAESQMRELDNQDSLYEKDEKRRAQVDATNDTVNRLKKKFKISEIDGDIASTLERPEAKTYYLSDREKDDYFEFLRNTILAYDNYAEELFWYWKGRTCYSDIMKDQCPIFSSVVDKLTSFDKMASWDPLKAEVNALLGEDDHQGYVPLLMPNVSLYMVSICRDYRYQNQLLPSARYHREQ
jgi:hypothetical protein